VSVISQRIDFTGNVDIQEFDGNATVSVPEEVFDPIENKFSFVTICDIMFYFYDS